MTVFVAIVCIVLGIVIISVNSENKKLVRKIRELEKRLNGEIPEKKTEVMKEESIDWEIKQAAFPEDKPITEVKEAIQPEKPVHSKQSEKQAKSEYSAKGVKNTLILISGAVFIILAAIVFLLSTWNHIPDLLKTTVLALLIVVFAGASKLAKKTFELEQTSKAFYFLAMFYTPIFFVSISVFELFGHYLGITGEGKYIYFAFSAVFVTILYLLGAYRKNSRSLFLLACISSMLSVLCISRIFTDDIQMVVFALVLYNLLLVCTRFKQVKVVEMFCREMNVFSISLAILMFVVAGFQTMVTNTVITTMSFLALAVNFLLITMKNKHTIYGMLCHTSFLIALLALLNVRIFQMATDIKQAVMILGIVGLFVLQSGINKKHLLWQKAADITTPIALIITYLVTSMISNDMVWIKNYIILYLLSLALYSIYLRYGERAQKALCAFVPLTFLLANVNLIVELEGNHHCYMLLAAAIFGISCTGYFKDTLLKKWFYLYGHVLLGLTFAFSILFIFEKSIYAIYYFIIMAAAYLYSYYKNRDAKVFQILFYLMLNLILVSLQYIVRKHIVDVNFMKYIPLITTAGIMGAMLWKEEARSTTNKIYVTIASVIAFFCINGNLTKTAFCINILFVIFHLIYNRKMGLQQYYDILPMIFMFPLVNNHLFSNAVLLPISYFVTILATMESVHRKKMNIYTPFSFLQLLLIFTKQSNAYLNILLFGIWSLVHFIFYENRQKDLFRALFYTACLLLYQKLNADWIDGKMVAYQFIGYVIFSLVILKQIVIKYITNIKVLEYLVIGFLYMAAISYYTHEFDGMIFTLFITILMFTSYFKRYGAVFLTSVIAILVNGFLLTKRFWFSIPWWAYLLSLGIILTAFAINNEIREKNNKGKLGKVWTNFKNKLDM